MEKGTKSMDENAAPFETRTYPLGGFRVRIEGKGKNEQEIWIEQVGDRLLVLVGEAATARRNGPLVAPTEQFASDLPPAAMFPRRERIEKDDLGQPIDPDHIRQARERASARAKTQMGALRTQLDTSVGETTVDLTDVLKTAAP